MTARRRVVIRVESKAVSPSTRMNLLGICFDTELLTMEVPQERVSECMGLLTEWLNKSEVMRKEVESLVGKLSFTAMCETGRLFISCLLEYLRGCQRRERWKFRCSKERGGGGHFFCITTESPWYWWKDGLYRMKWWRQMLVWVAVVLGLILRMSTFMPNSLSKSRCWIWVSTHWSY